MMDHAAMHAKLGVVRSQIRDLQQLANWLSARVETYPMVTPVEVFFRYGAECREESAVADDDADALLEAYRSLLVMEEAGECAPTGVEVGGYLYPMDELAARYPNASRW